MKALLPRKETPDPAREEIMKHRAASSDPNLLAKQVFVCQMTKCHDRTDTKVLLLIAGRPDLQGLFECVAESLVVFSGRIVRGIAPKGKT